MTDRELLQQALDALDIFYEEYGWGKKQQKAHEALRARLEEPPKDLELPLVRPAEFVRLIEGKENYWGRPVMRTEWPMPEPVIQARKEGNLIVADLPQVPTGSGGISKDTQPDEAMMKRVMDGKREANYKSFAQSAQVLGAQYDPRREPVIDKSMAKRIATQLGWEPKREWVGLTDEEARELCVANVPYVIDMVRALEAKLKEKNSG